MTLTFYTNPMSRGQIARWMLEEVGEPYETHALDFASGTRSDEYRRINPMMKVPAIVHDGRVVTEAAAICAYLADAFPAAGLGPDDATRADYYRWLFFAAGPLEQAVTNKAVGWEPTAERQGMFGYGSYDRAVAAIDEHLQDRTFVCGDRFTAADVYVGSAVLWGTQFGTLPALDSFKAYAARMESRDAYRRGKDIDNGLIASMKASQEADA